MKPRDDAKARDILAATLKEVEAVGLAGLSMEAVARRAGVATGTVYIYFDSKSALVNAAYLAAKHELSRAVPSTEGPVRVAFTRMCSAYVEYLLKHRAEVVFMTQILASPYLTPQTKEAAALGVRPMVELLERGKRELVLKDTSTDLMLAFLHGALSSLAETMPKSASRAERKRRLDEIVLLCWDGLKA